MEQVVRRSELHSEASTLDVTSQPDRVRKLIAFEFIEQEAPKIDQDVEDEDEMDFCLFAPTPGTRNTTQSISKVRLKSPTPTDAEAGLETPHRDTSYYFTEAPGLEELQRFASTAVSGQVLKTRSCSLCQGSSYSWKVQHVQATKAQALLLAQATAIYNDLQSQQEPTKRKRPGKKSRIKLRMKEALLKAAQIQDQKAAEVKEAADREKRTRRNREKKAKKKIREKAKKAVGVAEAVESDGTDGEDEASSQPG